MHLYLINNPINFHHHYISDSKVKLVTNFKDLGIISDTKINFFLHNEMIKNKAMQNLGLIKHTCNFFTDSTHLKLLYCSLVHSNLQNSRLLSLSLVKNTLRGKCQNQSKIIVYGLFHLNLILLGSLVVCAIPF